MPKPVRKSLSSMSVYSYWLNSAWEAEKARRMPHMMQKTCIYLAGYLNQY
jgi:hypothetical protein